MEKLDHFDRSQRALERGLWKRGQSEALHAASQKIIAQSMQVIQEASLLSLHLNKGNK